MALIADYMCATEKPLAQLMICTVRIFLFAYRLPAIILTASSSYVGKLAICIQSASDTAFALNCVGATTLIFLNTALDICIGTNIYTIEEY